jgi:Immunity protein 27
MNKLDQRLKANEDSVNGEWINRDGKMVGDSNCQRIEWLIHHHLQRVANSIAAGAWEILYRDPDDGRYWEKTYRQGEMHGGGPPSLQTIADTRIKEKYGPV